jgi:hypothetical protein
MKKIFIGAIVLTLALTAALTVTHVATGKPAAMACPAQPC